MVSVKAYTSADKKTWDAWLDGARGHCFLFYRDYMDYHADRFRDRSLLFYEEERLVAALPAHRDNDTLVSHGGLTYGGMIVDRHMTTSRMLAVFDALVAYLKAEGFAALVYKSLPYLYHEQPSSEDLYALFVHNAEIFHRDVSSAIYLPTLRIDGNRLRGAKKCAAAGVSVRRFDDFDAFLGMVRERLSSKYSLGSTHTPAEMKLLAARFPKAISLYGAFHGDELTAGSIIYRSREVAHVQYLSTTENGRRLRSADLLVVHLLTEACRDARWFDFGISTEQGGDVFNESLIKQKEEFGGSAVCFDTFRLDLKTAERRRLRSRNSDGGFE